jgi:hypothetical protein
MISELRILPPLSIARLGAASSPMDNYDVVVDPGDPLGYRALRPAETLEVDPTTGEITSVFVPARLAFTEKRKARPVAPFLEVWARTDENENSLSPLTLSMLESARVGPADMRWSVHLANHKVFRRSRETADRVEAISGDFSDHARHPLIGTCDNFWPGKGIPFGHAQYIKPNAAHPEIRLRFTPAAGFVYGSSRTAPTATPPTDANVRDVVYDASRGGWLGYEDRGPGVTQPGGIYASDPQGRSLGYLDDGCDGIVRVALTAGGKTLSTFARIGAGPPTYVPDAVPIRTIADELEQALLGPSVTPEEATIERVEEIVRRVFETVRLMNTDAMNRGGMAGHDEAEGRRRDPIMARSLVDDVGLVNLHQSLLVALRSGTAPWFADVLRNYDDIGDLTEHGRRKMPAMMRGADGRHLALTRRQVELVRTLVRGPIFPADDAPDSGR